MDVVVENEAVEEKLMEVRAVDPDKLLELVVGTVTYHYKQPAGVFMDTDSRAQGNKYLNSCLVEAVGLVGAIKLKNAGHKWSDIVPPIHALKLFVELYKAANITVVEAEG